MALNQFADISTDEFLEQLKLRVPKHLTELQMNEVNGKSNRAPMFGDINNQIPDYKNWYEDEVISASQEAFVPGTSWAVSAIESLEALAVITGEAATHQDFSIQQLIDCDITNSGTDGGWMNKAFAYTSKYGIMSKAEYPFSGQWGEC